MRYVLDAHRGHRILNSSLLLRAGLYSMATSLSTLNIHKETERSIGKTTDAYRVKYGYQPRMARAWNSGKGGKQNG